MMPHLTKGLDLADSSARLYTLRLLDTCKPAGMEQKLFEIALSDKDEDVALEAIRLLGAIGIPQELVITNAAKIRRLKRSRLESFVFQYSASPKVNAEAIAAISNSLPPTATLAGALAQAGDEKAFEIAGALPKAEDLALPWLWRTLAEFDSARACDLFRKRIADVLDEEGQADLIDALFEIAGMAEPDKCMDIAATYKGRGFSDACMRALSWTAHSEALAKLRETVYAPERSTEVLQRVRYLVEVGDYTAVGKVQKLLEKDEVKGIPRRANWAASMLTYFSSDSAKDITRKAFEDSDRFTSSCHALPQLARVASEEAADAMDEIVAKWVEKWNAEWKRKPETSYNSTALPELYYAMLPHRGGRRDCPPRRGRYASQLLEPAGTVYLRR
ncbi:MAG: hypothetical protein U5N86_04140 [Planctomycetota bacterium]|nr:hypothetical protein [Planctomycetota bacterium]